MNGLDTILEKASPENLDMTRHQLFIDTSKNSMFYSDIKNWKPSDLDDQATGYYKGEIRKKHKVTHFKLDGIATRWIKLKKFKNHFVIYYPCDGHTSTIILTKESIDYHVGLEPESDLISNLTVLSDTSWEFSLWTIPEKSISEKAKLLIQKTELEDVYKFTYFVGDLSNTEFYTPINNIQFFDLVVNHCNQEKVVEFGGFDQE